jgi:light-regulated signal transduction histidine kinase (bacteriophytochrome)
MNKVRLTYEPQDDLEIQISEDRRSAILLVRISHAVELALMTSTAKLEQVGKRMRELLAPE